MDNRPGVLSLFTFSIDPVFFFLSPPVSRQIYLIYLFLSFHLTSQKSGCRRCQLHLRPSKRRFASRLRRITAPIASPSLKIGTITSALLSSTSSEVIGINAFSPRAAQIF